MYELMVESRFSAAHQLREYNGKCENLHGHNWRVQIWVHGHKLQSNGILVDFCDLKNILDYELEKFDHTNLNDQPCFQNQNPTSENMARQLFNNLRNRIEQLGVRLFKVTVWESDKSMGGYLEE